MKNPWEDFDYKAESQFHPLDANHINSYNLQNSKSVTKQRLSDRHAPQPYFGSLDANVVILLANPTLDEREKEESVAARNLLNLSRLHETGNNHFIYLEPEMADTTGEKWWKPKLKYLLAQVGEDNIHKNLLVVDYHAYRSKNFSPFPITLPTQNYSFSIVEQKVKEKALFVLGHFKTGWLTAIPELQNVEKVEFKSINMTLSPNNLCEGGFAKISKRLS